ncbi:MAG TPA: PAS domain-containing sensor histidine kinase, partial [Candidatus Aenigmarchaeota archaeon]|nr:PAS domain-containing sensor histidine kinase [Candidatus Aenigmarchaeota archaeon]
LGYAESEIIGKNWFDSFIPPLYRKQIKEVSTRIFKGELESFEYNENPVLTKSGKERLIAWHNTILKDESGKVTGHLSSGEDITEKKKAETALKESEKRYHMLFDLLPYGGDVFNTEGIIETVSKTSEALFGYSSSELIGKHISFLLDPEYLPIFKKKFPLLLDGKPSSAEVVMVRKDGKKLNILRAAQPIVNESGKVKAILALNVDITAKKKAEEVQKKLEKRIQQTQKLESLGVLAGGIAHDFNNILTGVLGNAGLAQLSLSPASPALNNIKKIETSAQRAAELCNQLLAYSGKGKFVVQPVNLNHIVEEMIHLLEVSISKKAVLKYNLAKNLPAVDADITQIRQVIMNLIINASDAIDKKSGIITITTGAMECDSQYLTKTFLDDELKQGVYIYLEVSDTGHGMEEESKNKIFDPFFTTKFTGRGLGLAAVLGIMRGHKGAIKVYSELGKGTTFKILLPSSTKSASKISKHVSKGLKWRGEGIVLVADDEETIRAVGRETLEYAGFNVITAADGREALEKFRENYDKIILVLLDMTMPHLSGEEVFREIRRIRPTIKVILSSGYNEQEATNGFVGKGLAGFLQKPYRPQQLIDTVRTIITKK